MPIRLRSERGVTIIETTVILAVLFILAGAMSPIVSESITTARAVKAKNDASMIAMGLINLQKDLGGDALALSGAATALESLRLPEALATDGNMPSIDDPDTASGAELLVANLRQSRPTGEGNGNANRVDPVQAQRRKWLETRTGSITDHLVTNRRGYRFRRPGEYGGWNGPYVSADVKGDPWSNKYLINSQWLDGGSTAADSQGRPRRAVFVVSAGADGVVQTPFEQPINDARAYGDDIVIRIQ